MNVTFYNHAKRENSTLRPTGAGTGHSCIIKEGSSVSNPTIALKWTGSGAPLYNYAYISDFKRYYFVSDWSFLDRQWTAHLTVDVLATYKTTIGSSSKYVLRSASEENKTIIENKYPAKGTYTARAELGGTLSPGWNQYGQGGGVYVVTVIGSGNTNNSTNNVTQYQMSGPSVQNLITNAIDGFEGAYNNLTATDAKDAIMNMLRLPMRFTTDLAQYIKNVMWFPFSFPSGGAANLYLAKYQCLTLPDTVGTPLHISSGAIDVSGYPDADGRYWEYLAPFATYTFCLDPFGIITLDPADVLHSASINYTVHTDSMTGLGILRVYAANGLDENRLIAERTAQIGVAVPYGGSAPNYAGAIGGVAGIISAAVSESPLADMMMAGAVGNLISGSGYQGYSAGTSGGGCSVVGYPHIMVRVMSHADLDPTELGYPLCEIKTINTLSGFVQVNDGDITDSYATDAELVKVKSYLEGGFFYE